MTKNPIKQPQRKAILSNAPDPRFRAKTDHAKPFLEHVHELRLRLLWVVLAVIAGSMGGYFIHETLLDVVQKPLGETLYYTSPVGGLNFLIKLCISFGLVVALPVIFYNISQFFRPLLDKNQQWMILRYSLYSILLAYCGVMFAYFISLPAALHFLTNFGNQQIESWITVNEYYNFALAYLVGFALLFQLPPIILFINRIKPLKPGGMMKAQRWIVLGSFIVAAILTPTPDPLNQLIMAVPAILLYQVGVVLVWFTNRNRIVEKTVDFAEIPDDILEIPAQSAPKVRAVVPVTAQPALAGAMTLRAAQASPAAVQTGLRVATSQARVPRGMDIVPRRSVTRAMPAPRPVQPPFRVIDGIRAPRLGNI